MNPSCNLPCYMNSLSTNMLQIPWKMRGSNSKSCKYRRNGSFQLQIAAHSVESGRNKRKQKHNSQNNSGSLWKCLSKCVRKWKGNPQILIQKKNHFPNSNCQGDFPTPKIIFAVTYPIYINLPISNKVCFCLSWLCWLSWWFRTPGHQYGIPALWKQ